MAIRNKRSGIQTATTSQSIQGVILEPADVRYRNFKSGVAAAGSGASVVFHDSDGTSRAALPTPRNPHIGDHDDVVVDISDTPLVVGDTIQFHTAASGGETYDAVIDFINGSTDFDAIIEDVRDGFEYPSTRINANNTNVTHSGDDAIIILPDDGNQPINTLALADYNETFLSWHIFATQEDGTGISFRFNQPGFSDNLPVGFSGISYNHTNRHLIFHFVDADGNTAAQNSTNFGQLFDSTTALVGSDDHFFIEFTYNDLRAITHYTWEKEVELGELNIPFPLSTGQFVIAGPNTQALLIS